MDPLSQPEWRTNYASTEEHGRQVKLQFESEDKLGFMTRTTLREALSKYGETLSLAALGAIEKMGDTDKVRVIFDATHGC